MPSVESVATELKKLMHDDSNSGVSEYCGMLLTLLRTGELHVDELCHKTLLMPNNWCMREWKNKNNLGQVVRAHIKCLPLVTEYDKTEFGNLTRTWSIPMKFKPMGSVGIVVPLILAAENKKSASMKRSKSHQGSKSRSGKKSRSSRK